MNAPTVLVSPDRDAAGQALALALVALVGAAHDEGRMPHVVLTGGSTAEVMYAALDGFLDEGLELDVDWAGVHWWWGDERFVPAGDPDRNDRDALRLLARLGVEPATIHLFPARVGPLSLDDAVELFGLELKVHAPDRFDVVIAGVGPDGHVASLFPGRAPTHPGVDVVGVADSPKPPPQRLTMTMDRLSRSDEVWLVALGDAKADVVRSCLDGHDTPHGICLPAQQLRGETATIWHLDAEAASELRSAR